MFSTKGGSTTRQQRFLRRVYEVSHSFPECFAAMSKRVERQSRLQRFVLLVILKRNIPVEWTYKQYFRFQRCRKMFTSGGGEG